MNKIRWAVAVTLIAGLSLPSWSAEISGKVVDASGKPMEGVTVSAFDPEREMSVSVFSQADGSFRIDGLRDASFNVRGRLLGQLDTWQESVKAGANSTPTFYVEGGLLRGAYPMSVWRPILDSLVAAKSRKP